MRSMVVHPAPNLALLFPRSNTPSFRPAVAASASRIKRMQSPQHPNNTAQDLTLLTDSAKSEGFQLMLPDAAVAEAAGVGSRVLVVLMGWVNSTHRQLARYSRQLTRQNCMCLQTIQGTAAAFNFWDPPNTQHAARILDFISKHELCVDRKLVFYSFSNGGATVYEQVGILFGSGRYEKLHAATAGLIFDSCPAYWYLSKGMKGMTVGVPAFQAALIKAFYWVYANCCHYIFGDRPAQFWRRFLETDLGVPELYLYSMDDELTTFSDLDTLVGARIARKPGAVTKRVWEHSRHVAHLVDHPEEYNLSITSFLESIAA